MEEGNTPKEAWWAGARAGLGVPADTPRSEVAALLAKNRNAKEKEAKHATDTRA